MYGIKGIGEMNTLHQICCIIIGIFAVYICIYFILVSVCMCACVYTDVYEQILYAYFYSWSVAVPANVFCWIWPDFI